MAALVHGLPVVSTTPQVLAPEMRDGENILLVQPQDPDALADAIQRLWSDAAMARRIGQGAKELSQLFDWDPIADRTADLLRDVSRH